MYAFNENFVLPFSHDEVVHLKKAFLTKMPGDDELRYAGVRAFISYMLTHPGKSLIFMGAEFGQWHEWQDAYSLDWHLLDMDSEDGERHRGLHRFFKEVNNFYLANKPLWELDFSWDGFQWIYADDAEANTISFIRKDKKGQFLLVLCNFSPVFRDHYHVGAPFRGTYQEVFNTDAVEFGGRGRLNPEPLVTVDEACHGFEQKLIVDLPPMSAVILKCARKKPPLKKKQVNSTAAKKA